MDEVGGLCRCRPAVVVGEAVAGVVEAGRETAAEAVDGDVGHGLQLRELRELVEAADAGVGETAAGGSLLALGVIGFEGYTGAADDRGRHHECENRSDATHAAPWIAKGATTAPCRPDFPAHRFHPVPSRRAAASAVRWADLVFLACS
ncbi:hypothetical protein ABZT17_31200 [Streptomyces sp. NPDC005648]|uniref:hypothetical protein n=1 Tax=Streptomyces sp. NPDC005648 TaxID=3157044 RepID=UPI0033B51027